MSKFTISSHFDSGNINVLDDTDPKDIRLEIRKDNASDFFQWFHFSLEGDVGETYRLRICNAGQSSYNKGWQNYDVCTSWNRHDWFRTSSRYINGELIFDITLAQSSVYFAYFTPFSHERHLDLIASVQTDNRCKAESLGKTLDGRAITMLTLGTASATKKKVWVIAR